ncbi:MAG: NADH:flavin oxidoreductase [bacterium]|jgi:NADPH2 dehydrogenase
MSRLFSPLQVKGLQLKNRLVMPPLASDLATEDGQVTEKHFQYYLPRAQAGVGLIIIEHTYIEPRGQAKPKQLSISADGFISGLKELAAKIKEAGAEVAIQLAHAGSNSTLGQPVGPSAAPHPVSGIMPAELTKNQLAELVDAYRAAARRAVEAGFSAVEIHGAHAYLLNQFLSPLTNKRQDEYGGSLTNRLRFPLTVVAAVRAEVGPDYPIFYRLGADDGMPGGFVLEEAREAAPRLVEAGVDVLDISGGMQGSRPAGAPPANFAPLAAAIKEVVSVPVICTGRITEPQLAEKLLREGTADLIGVGRAMLKDAQWAVKAKEQLAYRP